VTRIIGGSARGRRLRTPTGNSTRPTADRVREALFSALESELGTISGLHVLDLFAGSGAVGLEARSRGAASVTMVEADRTTAGVIRQNVKDLGFDHVDVAVAKAERWVDQVGRSSAFDVVYADPPYPMSTAQVTELLSRLAESGRLAEDAVVVVERSRRGEGWVWPVGLEGVREKRYGETMLFYGRVETTDATPTRAGSS
jgi:16S rRNA (guanine966-N2)-methyltransferase